MELSLNTIPNVLIILVQVSQCYKQQKNITLYVVWTIHDIVEYMYVDKCMYTGCIGYIVLSSKKTNSHGSCVASPRLATPFPSAASQVADNFMVNLVFLHARRMTLLYKGVCW